MSQPSKKKVTKEDRNEGRGKDKNNNKNNGGNKGKALILLLCTLLAPILAFLVKRQTYSQNLQPLLLSGLLAGVTNVFSRTGRTERLHSFVGENILAYRYDGIYYREAYAESPFYDIALKLDKIDLRRRRRIYNDKILRMKGLDSLHKGGLVMDAEEQLLLEQWDDPDPQIRRLSRCTSLISSIYEQNANWTNADVLSGARSQQDDEGLIQEVTLLVERMRIYNYCFLDGELGGEGLDVEEVFSARYFKSKELDAWDFQCRMFPFLNCDIDIDKEMLWPDVFNLNVTSNTNDGDVKSLESIYALPKPSLSPETTLRSFNINFIRNWARNSKGRGIVTTMNFLQASLFGRHLRVLDKLENTLPIQVVTTDLEYNDIYLKVLLDVIQPSKQQVYLVNLGRVANEEFLRQYDDPYLFKWFATLFNTFKEELLIDANVVLFESTNSYFNTVGYQETGAFMYRDRAIPVNHTADCANYMLSLEPSLEESRLTNIKLPFSKYDLPEFDPITATGEEMVYHNFFVDNVHNHVDSGVVIMDKRRKFNGLLLGVMLNLIPLLRPCSHGDKEFFWLGQLYAGEPYTISQYAGAAAGELRDDYNEMRPVHRYTVCSTHIAHLNEQEKLSWVNGGLNRCKRGMCAELDFEEIPEYFVPYPSEVEDVKRYYNQPAKMDAVIIPFSGSWELGLECCGTENCAVLFEGDSRKGIPGEGILKRFSPSDMEYYNKIARMWSE